MLHIPTLKLEAEDVFVCDFDILSQGLVWHHLWKKPKWAIAVSKGKLPRADAIDKFYLLRL